MNKKLIDWWSGGASFDSDYQAWLTQIIADGGTEPSASVKTAQNALIVSLKAASLWARIKTMYFLHCGNTTTGRRNVKSPSTFRMSIVGTLVFSEGNGTKSNGTDGYFDQNFPANQYVGIETDLTAVTYISESSTTNLSLSAHGMRSSTLGAGYRFSLIPKASANGNTSHYNNATNSFANANHRGLYVMTHDGTNSVIYKDGVKTSAATTPTAPDIATDRYILARNFSGAGGDLPSEWYTLYVAYDILMNRVDDTDEATLRGLLNTYNTAVGLP